MNAIEAWLATRGWKRLGNLPGGRNNHLVEVSRGEEKAVLKIHRRAPADPRDRHGTERMFYALAAERGLPVPHWLDGDAGLGIALLEHVEGGLVSLPVGLPELKAAADFLRRINHPEPQTRIIASEACFTIQEHEALISRRLITIRDPVASMIREFLSRALIRMRKSGFAEDCERRIFSPGDFGFHNAVHRSDGKILFLDFEYAGWDDPVKTVADLFLQPEKPVGWEHLENFCASLPEWPRLAERVSLWIPFFAAKWAVILLKPSGAGVRENPAQQLEKARRVLERAERFLE